MLPVLQRDADLCTLTSLYNQIKPREDPLNGTRLESMDPLLQPSSVPYVRQAPRTHNFRPARTEAHQNMPSDSHHLAQLRALSRETYQAAGLLNEAVAFAAPDADLTHEDLIQEFSATVNRGVIEIGDQIAWVTSLADRKKDERREAEQIRAAENASRAEHEAQSGRFGSNNPFKRMVEGTPPTESEAAVPPATVTEEKESDEERTLKLMLDAGSAGSDALKLLDRHQDHIRELAQLREVQERSMLETKFDRSTAGTPDGKGAYHPASQAGVGEGTSHPPEVSANPYAAFLTPTKARRQSTMDSTPPNARLLTEQQQFEAPDYTDSPLASPMEEGAAEGAYGGLAELGNGAPPADGDLLGALGGSSTPRRTATQGSEMLVDPIEPSSKALGKLRRVSVRESESALQSLGQRMLADSPPRLVCRLGDRRRGQDGRARAEAAGQVRGQRRAPVEPRVAAAMRGRSPENRIVQHLYICQS